MEVTAGLAESNGSLLPGLWCDSLHVTWGLTACTPGSALGLTIGNEYGKTLSFTFYLQPGYQWHDAELSCCSLRPHREYQFRIAASNDVGSSNFSMPSRPVVTLEAAPGSPPSSLTALTDSATSVMLSWMVS